MSENNGVEIIDTSLVEDENPEPENEKPRGKRTKKEIIALSVSSGILVVLLTLVTVTLVIGFNASESTGAPTASWSTTSPGYYDANKQKVGDISVTMSESTDYYTLTSITPEEKGVYLVLPSSYGSKRITYTADFAENSNIFGNDGKDDNLVELYAQRLYWKIGSYSFAHLGGLTKVSLSSGVSTSTQTQTQVIGDHAFYDCPSLTTVELPRNITSIGAYAFASTNISSVIYPSTMSAWNSVSKGENAFPRGTVITCTDGTTDPII